MQRNTPDQPGKPKKTGCALPLTLHPLPLAPGPLKLPLEVIQYIDGIGARSSNDGERPGALLARRTEEGWSLMIFCARATRGCRLPSLDARTLGTSQVTPPCEFVATSHLHGFPVSLGNKWSGKNLRVRL